MRSHSPQITSEPYKCSVNFFTPLRDRHISQPSTGKHLFECSPSEAQQIKHGLIPQLQQRLLEKQKLFGTSGNYYQGYGKLKKETLNNYSSVLFKSGYEQQEEIKRLNKENESLKETIKKQEEKLSQYLEMGDILEKNRLLQEQVERLEKVIQQGNQKENSQKLENE
ncbi:unnamed protein product [Paramecium octaurelia]|uniref:Uncharacterized protein n=1 Tax=Paramecium octaurelia TaxID=43137 RepID=A0A8S1U5D3_PAROT|nr:unnamed protein product [Paramecium octaurelia]